MEGQILKTLVGSRAHGLETPTSDYDYRGVFVVPTRDILSLGGHKQQTSWIEGKDDDTAWELGHFLHLATQCNPTILETFLSPVIECTEEGEALRELFPYIWEPKRVRDAFIGYGLNQRKKFLEDKDERPNKFAAAYLRSLYNAYELLSTGTFTVRIAETEMGEYVRRLKYGEYSSKGEVIDICNEWEQKIRDAFIICKQVPDMDKVNDFLLKVRKNHW